MKVLYVEDDPVAGEFVSGGLSRQGFEVEVASNGADGLALVQKRPFDILILDVMLPDIKGFELLEQIREAGIDAPVLFLSSRGEVDDRLRGFELGADDYLPKPFALSELTARLKVIARRRLDAPDDLVLRVDDLVLDLQARRVERAGQTIELPPKSFALLQLLMSRAGRLVTREAMIDAVWGPESDLRPNALDVQINQLRRLVDQPFDRKLIRTKPGQGYLLEEG